MNTNTTLSKGSWIQLNQRRAARTGNLSLLLLLMLPVVVQAQFNYTDNGDGTATITGYTGSGGAVDIPSTIAGLPVTSIGFLAFAFYYPGPCSNCLYITSVTIPDSVTTIGGNAFQSCIYLGTVTIGTNVTSIGNNAFSCCSRLSSITIPDSVTNIGGEAFSWCTSLTSITIPDRVISIGEWAFNSCTSLTNVTIANGVSSMGSMAFGGCTGLTDVTILNGVIGDYAFASCSSLTTATIGNGVTNIGSGPFSQCTRLTAIAVDEPNPIYSIVDGVLFNKSHTTLITYPAGKAVVSYAIPNTVTRIGDNAFNSCSSLTNITIPNSVTGIPYSAFYSCTGLSSVTIPNSVTDIGQGAFSACGSLTRVTIGNSVTNLGYGAFWACTNLTTVYFTGNAPRTWGDLFFRDYNATVYYSPGTTGWGAMFEGRPTALWTPANPPTIQTSPQTQTAEAGSAVRLNVQASSPLPLFCVWYLNSTNLLICSTSCELELTNGQFSQSGAYTAVITNAGGAITSSPAMLQVIAAVDRTPVPGVKVTGQTGSLWNVDYADSLSSAPNWTPLGSVSLTGTSEYYFDLTLPLPPQRFYRAWQTGTPGVRPSLDLHPVPAITLTGTIGHSVRLDYINQFGPTDAWVTLATVPLTNTSQLYFDISAHGQPQRLYRLVPSP
jgi:hypothetical protein